MDTILKELEVKLKGLTGHLDEEVKGVRTNRPSVGLIEDIKVDYYGQIMPIKQLASISAQPPRDLVVSVWDKGAAPAVAKGIETAKAGFSVASEGSTIRVTLPPMTDERRTEMVKLVKKMAEETRISLRAARDEANKRVKAAEDSGEAREDEARRAKDQIQKLTDQANQTVEALVERKLSEIAE